MFAQAVAAFLKQQDMHCKLERIKHGLINAVKVENDDDRHGVEEVGLGWQVDAWNDGGGEDAAVDEDGPIVLNGVVIHRDGKMNK